MGINSGFVDVLVNEGLRKEPYKGNLRCSFTKSQFCNNREAWDNALRHAGLLITDYWTKDVRPESGNAKIGSTVTAFIDNWVYLYVVNENHELVSMAFTTLNTTGITGGNTEDCMYGTVDYYPVNRFNWAIYPDALYKKLCMNANDMAPELKRDMLPCNLPIIYGSDVPNKIKEILAKNHISLLDDCGYIFAKHPRGGFRVKRVTMHPRTIANLERFSKKYGRESILAEIADE